MDGFSCDLSRGLLLCLVFQKLLVLRAIKLSQGGDTIIFPVLGSTTVVKVSQNIFSNLTIDLVQNLILTFDLASQYNLQYNCI